MAHLLGLKVDGSQIIGVGGSRVSRLTRDSVRFVEVRGEGRVLARRMPIFRKNRDLGDGTLCPFDPAIDDGEQKLKLILADPAP